MDTHHGARAYSRVGLCLMLTLAPGSLRAAPAATPEGPTPAPTPDERIKSLESKLAAQAEASKEAEDRFNEIKSGKLIRYGITGGVAFAVTTPFAKIGGVRQNTADITAMPYLALLPAYWRGGYHRATHVACASEYAAGQESARKVAIKLAREDADLVVDAMLAEAATWPEARPAPAASVTAEARVTELQKRLPLPANKITLRDSQGNLTKNTSDIGKFDAADIEEVIVLRRALDATDKDKEKIEALRANLVTRIANRIWVPTLDARCVAHKWGVWVGVPLPYDTVMRENDTTVSRRTSGGFAGGLTYTPFAYLSINLGLAYSVYRPDPAMPGVDAPNIGVLTPVISLGGNLDIFTLFRGKG